MTKRQYALIITISILLLLSSVLAIAHYFGMISIPKPEPKPEKPKAISLEDQLRMKNFTVIAGTISQMKNNIYTSDLTWFVQEAKNHNVTTLFYDRDLFTQYVAFRTDDTRYRLRIGVG